MSAHAGEKRRFRLSKGLTIPIAGAPTQEIVDGPAPKTVALVADDYIGMKPTMVVKEGDDVKLGQLLFEDKKTPGVLYTSPAAGKVAAINRGAKRKFESIVIDVAGDAAEEFTSYTDGPLQDLERDTVRDNLVKSGLWTALRTRPYGKVPAPETTPHSLFVTAIDTNPLAVDPTIVLKQPNYDRWFIAGLQALGTLTDGPTFLCTGKNADIPGKDENCVTTAEFSGPHPAGLAGTHIHFLDPVDEHKVVWHIGYQDVAAVGHLFLEGKLLTDRVVSLAGPAVSEPQVIRTRLGAALPDLTHRTCKQGDRIISGSVLAGRATAARTDFLGRYHQQISALEEGRQRELLGWAMPGLRKFSVTRAFVSALTGASDLPMTTSSHGSLRAIVPIGSYEKVMPLDIIATALMKSLMSQDPEIAMQLGCLELIEEDLALCTFVCPGKNDYGPLLRRCLTHIEAEG